MTAKEILEERIALAQVSADNEDYLIRLSIKEAKQALAALDVPAGEFTKPIKEAMINFLNLYGEGSEHFPPIGAEQVIALCDRLDRAMEVTKALIKRAEAAEAENKRLKEKFGNIRKMIYRIPPSIRTPAEDFCYEQALKEKDNG